MPLVQRFLRGLPGYSGPIPGSLIFEGVRDLKVSIELLQERKFRIYAIEETHFELESENNIAVRLSPAGLLELRCSGIKVLPKKT